MNTEKFMLTAQQLSAGFQNLAAAAERADLLYEFRDAALKAEIEARLHKVDARERRRQRHRRKTRVVHFLYE